VAETPQPGLSGPPDDGGTDAAERGRLHIADRVVERVAGQAARETDGIVAVGSTLDGAVGRRYPKVDAEVAGGRVRITVEVATLWPIPLARATGDVRAAVTERVEHLVGLQVDSVDVHAAKVVLDDRARPARRVE
jgi:uncharacterized alkaline shock family protein YloU